MALYTGLVGGDGGQDFVFCQGCPVKTLRVWPTRRALSGIEVVCMDGHTMMAGRRNGSAQQFTFEPGECISELSLWGNGIGTRCGGIKFKTDKGREFFCKMTEWGLKTEFAKGVGSGILVGAYGKSGHHIDCLGLQFLDHLVSAELVDLHYANPRVDAFEERVASSEKTVDYRGITTPQPPIHYTHEETLEEEHRWSCTYGDSFGVTIKVTATLPDWLGGAGIEAGASRSHSSSSTTATQVKHTTRKSFSQQLNVPPGECYKFAVSVKTHRARSPWAGMLRVTTARGTLQWPVSGEFSCHDRTSAKFTAVRLLPDGSEAPTAPAPAPRLAAPPAGGQGLGHAAVDEQLRLGTLGLGCRYLGVPPGGLGLSTRYRTHTVQHGDNAWQLAQPVACHRCCDVDAILKEMAQLNPHIPNLAEIFPGQELHIPE